MLLCPVTVSYIYGDPQEVFARSFMYTRPVSYHTSLNQQAWHAIIYPKHGDTLGSFQVIGYYQGHRPQSKTARYFLLGCKNELLVSGDTQQISLRTRDIRAEWLGLPANFSGTFTLCPQQRQMGFSLWYNQELRTFFDSSFFENTWLSIELPVILVENSLGLRQANVTNPGISGPRDICGAFSQKEWKYGRIASKRERMRPTEIRLTLGRTLLAEDHFELVSYSMLVIPTGNEQDARFMFDAVSGNNQHVAFGAGVHMQVALSRHNPSISWNWFTNLEGLFLIRNKQMRTFDLVGKPFSRFMLFIEKNGPPSATIPGVNVLTREALVRPYGIADFSTGLRIHANWFELELGYGVWGKSSEDVKLRSSLSFPCEQKCIGEFGIAGDPGEQNNAVSASTSTISQRGPNDQTFVSIQDFDLDTCSAAAGSALVHTIHAGASYIHLGKNVDAAFGSGFFFDLPQKNSALATWALWWKVGATF